VQTHVTVLHKFLSCDAKFGFFLFDTALLDDINPAMNIADIYATE
jgi:hypothetical protein